MLVRMLRGSHFEEKLLLGGTVRSEDCQSLPAQHFTENIRQTVCQFSVKISVKCVCFGWFACDSWWKKAFSVPGIEQQSEDDVEQLCHFLCHGRFKRLVWSNQSVEILCALVAQCIPKVFLGAHPGKGGCSLSRALNKQCRHKRAKFVTNFTCSETGLSADKTHAIRRKQNKWRTDEGTRFPHNVDHPTVAAHSICEPRVSCSRSLPCPCSANDQQYSKRQWDHPDLLTGPQHVWGITTRPEHPSTFTTSPWLCVEEDWIREYPWSPLRTPQTCQHHFPVCSSCTWQEENRTQRPVLVNWKGGGISWNLGLKLPAYLWLPNTHASSTLPSPSTLCTSFCQTIWGFFSLPGWKKGGGIFSRFSAWSVCTFLVKLWWYFSILSQTMSPISDDTCWKFLALFRDVPSRQTKSCVAPKGRHWSPCSFKNNRFHSTLNRYQSKDFPALSFIEKYVSLLSSEAWNSWSETDPGTLVTRAYPCHPWQLLTLKSRMTLSLAFKASVNRSFGWGGVFLSQHAQMLFLALLFNESMLTHFATKYNTFSASGPAILSVETLTFDLNECLQEDHDVTLARILSYDLLTKTWLWYHIESRSSHRLGLSIHTISKFVCSIFNLGATSCLFTCPGSADFSRSHWLIFRTCRREGRLAQRHMKEARSKVAVRIARNWKHHQQSSCFLSGMCGSHLNFCLVCRLCFWIAWNWFDFVIYL